MATSFVFRPHVHEREIVATPDLLIDSLSVARGNQTVPIPVDRLTTDTGFQVAGPGTTADAALALVGAGAGMLIGVASDHRRRDDPSGRLPCAKPICREVWRHADVADHVGALVLRGAARQPDGEMRVVQEGSAASLLGAAGSLPPGRAVLCTGLEMIEPVFASTDFEIVLEDPVLGRRITLRYGVVDLTATAG